MGFKPTDVVPYADPSAITPPGLDVKAKAFQVLRTDTAASVKAILPFNASVVDILIYGVASNATSATVSIGTTATSTEWVNAQDVKTAGGLIRPTTVVNTTNLPNLVNIPQTGDLKVYAKYAESGTASSDGGPYTVIIFYVQ